MTVEELISEETLITVFANANFGNSTRRDIVRYALLKTACGYYNGFTAQQISKELKLIGKNNKLTKKGQEYLYEAFRNGTNH